MLKTLRPSGTSIQYKTSTPISFFSNYHPVFYQSGTAALAAAIISAVKSKPDIANPQILLPAYACPDLISAILYAKATPVLIDFEPNTPWMDTTKIQKSLDHSTVAIIAVNFLGIPERISEIRSITQDNDLLIIEDSAQGLPTLEDQNYWNGDLIVLSFSRGKPVNLLHGGAVLSRHSKFRSRLPIGQEYNGANADTFKFKLKIFIFNLIIKPNIYYFFNLFLGSKIGNTRFIELDNIYKLPKANQLILNTNFHNYCQRSRIQDYLNDRIETIKSPLLINLPNTCNIDSNKPLLRYPILITNSELRSRVINDFTQEGLGANTLYGTLLPNIENIPSELFGNHKHTASNNFSNMLLTLPTHEDVTTHDVDKIINILKKHLKD